MKKQIKDFLMHLTYLFPLEGKRLEPVLETYSDILLEKFLKKEYDLKKLTSYIVQNYKFRTFPTAEFILECLPMAEIHKVNNVVNEGEVIIMKLPNGMMYSFTVTGYGKHLTEIEGRLKGQYGECVVTRHPKGTTLIGTRIFEPDGEVVQE